MDGEPGGDFCEDGKPVAGRYIDHPVRDAREKQKRAGEIQTRFSISGSPARTRTADLVVNSHPLYRLSYRGISRPRIVPSMGERVNFFRCRFPERRSWKVQR